MLDIGLAIPRHVVVEGDGQTSAKGLKCEWMTVKEDALWMGSVGKEWVVNGEVKSTNNLWVKRLTPDGTAPFTIPVKFSNINGESLYR